MAFPWLSWGRLPLNGFVTSHLHFFRIPPRAGANGTALAWKSSAVSRPARACGRRSAPARGAARTPLSGPRRLAASEPAQGTVDPERPDLIIGVLIDHDQVGDV